MRGKTNQSHHFFLIFPAQLSSIGPNSGQSNTNPLLQPKEKRLFAQKLPILGLLFLAPLGACKPQAVEDSAPLPESADITCGHNGVLETSLHGGIETDIKWTGSDMVCESMQRPDSQGARLRFAGDAGGEQLAIIVALPALRAGEPAIESPSNVTVIVEGAGRFFSTPGLESCWTDVTSQSALGQGDDLFAIEGTLYCIAPLGEVNGETAVTIPKLSFSTIVEWSGK